MRKVTQPPRTIDSARRVRRFSGFVALRQPCRRRRWNHARRASSNPRIVVRGGLIAGDRSDLGAGEQRNSLRFRAGDLIHLGIAVLALAGGLIVVINSPEFLVPLLPVELLIACEFILWNDISTPFGESQWHGDVGVSGNARATTNK